MGWIRRVGSRAITWEPWVMQRSVKSWYEWVLRASTLEVRGLIELARDWEGYVRINEVYDYSWCYGSFESEKQGHKRQENERERHYYLAGLHAI